MTTLTKNTDLLKQEVRERITADAVVQGNYWSDGKGCFIGCLTYSGDPTPAVERFGLTESILRIAERIFESLPLEEAKEFFFDFADAVAMDGKDLSLIHWVFLGETLRNLPHQRPGIQAVIDPVINGMDLLASGNVWEKEACAASGDAAWAASCAAGDAETRRQRESLLRLIREAPVVTPS